MWKYKTDCKGELTPAVNRRMERCPWMISLSPCGSTHEGRIKFGYCYLEFVKVEE